MFNAGELYNMGNEQALGYVERLGVADLNGADKVSRIVQMCEEAPSLRRAGRLIRSKSWKRARWQKGKTRALSGRREIPQTPSRISGARAAADSIGSVVDIFQNSRDHHRQEFHARTNIELREDLPEVCPDRGCTDEQLVRQRLRAPSDGELLHDLRFSLRQSELDNGHPDPGMCAVLNTNL